MQWTAVTGDVEELLGAHEFAPAADDQPGNQILPHRNVDDMYASLSFEAPDGRTLPISDLLALSSTADVFTREIQSDLK